MRDIVFVIPTHKYDSYTDYRKLIEVSGFETCSEGQIDVNRNCTYIVSPFNGDVDAAMKARPKVGRTCKIIHWFLERPGTQDFKTQMQDLLNMVDDIWISDRAMAKLANHDCVKFVPVGGDERLGYVNDANKAFDIVHMCYVYGRRDRIIHRLRCSIGPNGWGEERYKTLLNTKFMLNVHQDEGKYYEPLRFALCAAYAIPMISEQCVDPYPYEDGIDFLSAPYDKLNALVERVIHEGVGKFKDVGMRMHDKVTKQFRFIDNVKKAVI